MSADKLKVVLLWHMHQPQYRDLLSNTYHLPWTYLHAIKDYTDMAAHLEAIPEARAVVNFAPLLLDELEHYARSLDGFLNDALAIPDPLLAALVAPAPPATDPEARRQLIKACLRANDARMIARHPPYRELAETARDALDHPAALRYLSDQFFYDLLVWYHLAWLGETVRRSDARARRFMDKAAGYSLHDRRELLALIHELIAGIVPRYRRLYDRGQVELSVTPYAHPILPLLIDFASAREAMPDIALPRPECYPGGAERARWHVQEGIRVFERHFGRRPAGCWPAEGAVSLAALAILAEAGFAWAASGEGVLRHTLARLHHAEHAMRAAWLYRPYRTAASADLACFFRDDGLSDLIGFTYSGWQAEEAVADLVQHLERIAEVSRGHPDRIVTIALDGENAWEHYPENGYHFLRALYTRLASHPRLMLTTFSDYLAAHPVAQVAAAPLPTLVAGSWVYGTFSTWIGEPSKNRGWERLVEAKQAYDRQAGALDAERARRAAEQLAVCEGSDWFWWFGDENPAATVSDFERLYRQHLGNLYQWLGLEPPESLAQALSVGAGSTPLGGVMRPGSPATGGRP
jgi:alpha-amylase/alpha-mannosidase (GH57 family)